MLKRAHALFILLNLFVLFTLITGTVAPPGDPVISLTPCSTSFHENDTVAVSCIWHGGNVSDRQLKLYCPNSLPVTGSSVVDMKLKITKKMHKKVCTCEGTHANRTVKDSQNLTVYSEPDLRITNKISTYTANKTLYVNITCYVHTDGYPTTYSFKEWRHTWNKREIRTIPATVNSTRSSQLIINNFSYEDTGVYICSLETVYIHNGEKTLYSTASSEVKIKWKPVFGEVASRPLILGQDYLLKLSFLSYPEFKLVSWSKVGKKSKQINYLVSRGKIQFKVYDKVILMEGYRLLVPFEKVSKKDIRDYTVNISNAKGWATKIVQMSKLPLLNKTRANSLSTTYKVAVITFFFGCLTAFAFLTIAYLIIKKRDDKSKDLSKCSKKYVPKSAADVKINENGILKKDQLPEFEKMRNIYITCYTGLDKVFP